MQKGKVKWFSTEKGFGFIESQGKEYFIHFKEIVGEGFKTLHVGDDVSFVPTQSQKGPVASQLVVETVLG